MQVLYAARYARCDVIRCINMMACHTTKWTATQDQELDDLMGYIMETVTWKNMGWIGDSIEELTPHLFADAIACACVTVVRLFENLV